MSGCSADKSTVCSKIIKDNSVGLICSCAESSTIKKSCRLKLPGPVNPPVTDRSDRPSFVDQPLRLRGHYESGSV